MNSLEQVFDIVKRSEPGGITVSEIAAFVDASIGKKVWARRARALRVVNRLNELGLVDIRNRRVTVAPNADRSRNLSRVLGAGQEKDMHAFIDGLPELVDVLEEGGTTSLGDDADLVEVKMVLSQNTRAGTVSRLGIPDFVALVRRPQRGINYMEVHSFEVKGAGHESRESIFQAIAHRALGIYSHSWLILVVGTESRDDSKWRQEIVDAATREGIGVIWVDARADLDHSDDFVRLLNWPKTAPFEASRQAEQLELFKLVDEYKRIASGFMSEDEMEEI